MQGPAPTAPQSGAPPPNTTRRIWEAYQKMGSRIWGRPGGGRIRLGLLVVRAAEPNPKEKEDGEVQSQYTASLGKTTLQMAY